MFDSLSDAADRLRIIASMGTTDSMLERLRMLRTHKLAIMQIMPFVAFGASNKIKCWPVPVPEMADYEILFVTCSGTESFPGDPNQRCKLNGTSQLVMVMDGELLVQNQAISRLLRPGDSITIDDSSPFRFTYKDATVLFKQTPFIATDGLEIINIQ